MEWNLFEGGATHRRVELAEAERRAAEDEVTAARDQAIREVWKAYTDVHLAIRRLDVAAALVDASQKTYEAMLASYRQGLTTLIDLLAARRELSRARFVDLDTKLQLLQCFGGARLRHRRISSQPLWKVKAMGPYINIIGSFFPSWMLCALIGIGMALFGRWLFVRTGLDPYVGPPKIIYSSLAILVTLVLWVAFFRG